MRRLIIAFVMTAGSFSPASAATQAEIGALYDALSMRDVIEIMQTEGMDYGADLRDELFPGRGGNAWPAMVGQLYDADAMDALVRARFEALMEDVDVQPLLTFFRSDLGARIIRLEIEARRALMDEGVEDVAKETLQDMRQSGDPRLDLLDDFVEANDLVESNVVGAMNANYAFYIGLSDGGAFSGDMTESDILSDVWSQEPEIRADTLDWVYAYLALAYQPLDDDAVVSYTDLSRTDAGRALNQAIFGAFDAMYTTISGGLGRGAAGFILGEDL